MSRVVSNLLAAGILCLVSASPSQSDPVTDCKRGITYRSHCGPGDPELGMKRYHLIPWFAELKKKITEQPDYAKLTEGLMRDDKAPGFMMCDFTVGSSGEIVNPKIHFTSGSPSIDNKFLNIIVNSGPLAAPANNLPMVPGIEVSLLRFDYAGKKFIYLTTEVNMNRSDDVEAPEPNNEDSPKASN